VDIVVVSASGKEVIKATNSSISSNVSGHFCGETKEHLRGAQNKLGVFKFSKD